MTAVLLVACAVVEPPPGGPVDITPPYLMTATPDSGATGVGGLEKVTLEFSEKMDRTSAATWLHFFPDQRIRKTSWKGATTAEITLDAPLPADTVVVIEIAAGMRDAHKIKSHVGRRFPVATGDSIPSGRISGVLIMADSAVTRGVVELFDVPPDTLEYFQQPLLRRTVTDGTGRYVFDWLPIPGGPWLVRSFDDADGDLRPGEREAQRLHPDTLSLDSSQPAIVAGVTTLFSVDTPGRLRTGPFTPPLPVGRVMAFTLAVTDEDTGYVPVPFQDTSGLIQAIDPETGGMISEVRPGINRLILFVDTDGDSLFGAVPESLLNLTVVEVEPAPDDTLAFDPGWYLEPWRTVEELEVDPGLVSDFTITDTVMTVTPWTAPRIAAADTLNADAAVDSTALWPEVEE